MKKLLIKFCVWYLAKEARKLNKPVPNQAILHNRSQK